MADGSGLSGNNKLPSFSDNLGLVDSLIAATAVGLGAILCTFNVKHFRVVAGLQMQQPYKR